MTKFNFGAAVSHRRIPNADKLRMVELYKQGMPIASIAKEVGWTPGGLYRAIAEFGIPLREKHKTRNRGSILARARNRIGHW